MRTFFGELVCECESLDLIRYPMSGPDPVMEIVALYVICVDCSKSFQDAEDTPSSAAATAS